MPKALVVNDKDNVATALVDLAAGPVRVNEGEVHLLQSVRRGHKFAVRPIAEGSPVVKYGQTIGFASASIAVGEHVHVHNVSDPLPNSRDEARRARSAWAERLAGAVPPPAPSRTFLGYRRRKGPAGARNRAVVMSTVGCSNSIVERVVAETGAVPVVHEQGCLQLGSDLKMTIKQLEGVIANPNVGGVVLVSLGCETLQPARLAAPSAGKPVEVVRIQEAGGTRQAIKAAVEKTKFILASFAGVEREPVPLSDLLVGTKCGGSDGLSGLTANPALGAACDILLDAGGGVILSETPGLFGSEPVLLGRLPSDHDRVRLGAALDRVWEESVRLGEVMSEGEMSPGNVEGGLTTLVEKSYGATVKAGSRPFQGFLAMGERPSSPGAWILDAPGIDVVTVSAEVCAGAQVIAFTTGRGSPVGNAIAPVLKICSNRSTFERMVEDMDIDASTIASGEEVVVEVGARIAEQLIAVASGAETKAESLGHREFALARVGSTL